MSNYTPTAFNLPLNSDMPEGWTPLEAVVVLECLDEQGTRRIYHCSTETLTEWTMVGMLTGVLDSSREDLKNEFISGDVEFDSDERDSEDDDDD